MRATAEASLCGFELRANASRAMQSMQAMLDGGIALLSRTRSLRMWVQLPQRCLHEEHSARFMGDLIASAQWAPGSLVLVVTPADACEPAPVARAWLRRHQVGLAVSGVGDLHHPRWRRVAATCQIEELRLSGRCTAAPSAARSLAPAVAQLRGAGLRFTALEVSSVEQFELALAAKLDYVQGPLVGAPCTLDVLESTWPA